jgi:hypothetical protein
MREDTGDDGAIMLLQMLCSAPSSVSCCLIMCQTR